MEVERSWRRRQRKTEGKRMYDPFPICVALGTILRWSPFPHPEKEAGSFPSWARTVLELNK